MNDLLTSLDELPSHTGNPISSAVLIPNIFNIPVIYLAMLTNKL